MSLAERCARGLPSRSSVIDVAFALKVGGPGAEGVVRRASLACMFVPMATLLQLDEVLTRLLGSKLQGFEVHAYLLGTMTTANIRLYPERIFSRFSEEGAAMGRSSTELMELFQITAAYWNHLLKQGRAGRVQFAPLEMREGANIDELRLYTKRRQADLTWYFHGLDSTRCQPNEYRPDGELLLRRIKECQASLETIIERLGVDTNASSLCDIRLRVLEFSTSIERIVADLVAVSEAVRDETHAKSTAQTWQSARPKRVRPNEPCPCGRGRKWKKCCGRAEPMN